MLKLRIALCLALVVGTLTLTNGILYGARLTTIIYRVLISLIVFGIAGYFLGFVGEKFFKELLLKYTPQEQHIDVVSQQEQIEDLPSENAFSPFTSENFEQISRPK
ncbi:hypothetical protein [Pelosinus sp. sgz500959]|uniref:hypothetical protein n=1 Tax=Pelosinus sp. sgz500959 TaxID=3242472 RepID=UPI00366C991B